MTDGITPRVASDPINVDEVTTRANELLRTIDPGPFSPAAFSVFKGKIAEYIAEVARESATLARRSQVDIISVRDVEEACERLTTSPRNRLYRHLGTVGGLALGTGGSALASMVIAGQYPPWGVVLTVLFVSAGCLLLGMHFRND